MSVLYWLTRVSTALKFRNSGSLSIVQLYRFNNMLRWIFTDQILFNFANIFWPLFLPTLNKIENSAKYAVLIKMLLSNNFQMLIKLIITTLNFKYLSLYNNCASRWMSKTRWFIIFIWEIRVISKVSNITYINLFPIAPI